MRSDRPSPLKSINQRRFTGEIKKFINNLPTTTVYRLGSGAMMMQWVAVITQSGLISVPPQVWPPFS